MDAPRLRNLCRNVKYALQAENREGLMMADEALGLLLEEFGETTTFDLLRAMGQHGVRLSAVCAAVSPIFTKPAPEKVGASRKDKHHG